MRESWIVNSYEKLPLILKLLGALIYYKCVYG